MASSTSRARYENQLAFAGRALSRARGYADEMGMEGNVSDLQDLYYEVCKLLEDSLKGQRRRLNAMGQPELPFAKPGDL